MSLAELESILIEYLGAKSPSRFGVTLVHATPDCSMIDVELRFLSGETYCCSEPGCHLPRHCDGLIDFAAERSVVLPRRMTVHWHCIIEAGARMECNRAMGLPFESEAYEFDDVSGGPDIAAEDARNAATVPPTGFTGLWTIVQGFGDRIETEYVKGVPNGCYRHWLKSGVCIREGRKKDGQWDGPLITRQADGTILDTSEFNAGTGTYRIFNAAGRLTDEIPLRHGKKHGAAKSWRSGKLVVRHFVDGRSQDGCGI